MESEIKFNVTLDDARVPQEISWMATDSGTEGNKKCIATMISIWDPKENSTLRIDLWTKEMLVDDMKRFFYENFVTMAETYLRATNDAECAKDIRDFAEKFGSKITRAV